MKYTVKWETTVSIARPYYQGKTTIYAFPDTVKEKAKKEISRDGCFSPSEIKLLSITEEL